MACNRYLTGGAGCAHNWGVSTTTVSTKHFSAADVLGYAIRIGQADLAAEYTEAMEHGDELWARLRNARTAGFLAITDEGEYVLTPQGERYLRAVAA